MDPKFSKVEQQVIKGQKSKQRSANSGDGEGVNQKVEAFAS